MLASTLIPLSFKEPPAMIEDLAVYYKKLGTGKVFLLHIGKGNNKTPFKRYETLLKQQGLLPELLLREGPVSLTIVKTAEEQQVDYITLPFHKKNWISRMITGSHIKDVVRLSDTPVFIYKKNSREEVRAEGFKALYTLSLHRGDQRLLPYIQNNEFSARQILFLHVGRRAPDPVTEKKKQQNVQLYLEQMAREGGYSPPEVQMESRLGSPRHEILKTIRRERCDLVFLGKSNAPEDKDSILGSTAENVSYNAPCSSMIVSMPGEEEEE